MIYYLFLVGKIVVGMLSEALCMSTRLRVGVKCSQLLVFSDRRCKQIWKQINDKY